MNFILLFALAGLIIGILTLALLKVLSYEFTCTFSEELPQEILDELVSKAMNRTAASDTSPL